MTTDTKAVARWDGMESDVAPLMVELEDGDYVRFTDHEQVVAELNRKLLQMILGHQELRSALAAKSAEVEGLAKDAERYRWLRDKAPEEWDISIERGYGPQNDRITEIHVQDYLDDAIDAAMEKSNEHQDQ
jgi:hypothetical protein